MGVLASLDRLAGRFNRWFGVTAVAAHAEAGGSTSSGVQMNPMDVKIGLGAIEHAERGERDLEQA